VRFGVEEAIHLFSVEGSGKKLNVKAALTALSVILDKGATLHSSIALSCGSPFIKAPHLKVPIVEHVIKIRGALVLN